LIRRIEGEQKKDAVAFILHIVAHSLGVAISHPSHQPQVTGLKGVSKLAVKRQKSDQKKKRSVSIPRLMSDGGWVNDQPHSAGLEADSPTVWELFNDQVCAELPQKLVLPEVPRNGSVNDRHVNKSNRSTINITS
jgi:hypothetical protein